MAKAKPQAKKIEALIIGKKNIYLFLIGLAAIALGYILMAQPPVYGFLTRTLAPIILVIAYLVIIPIAIMIKSD